MATTPSSFPQEPTPEEWGNMSDTEKAQLITQIDQVSGPIIEKYRNASADELQQALQSVKSSTELDVLRTLHALKTETLD